MKFHAGHILTGNCAYFLQLLQLKKVDCAVVVVVFGQLRLCPPDFWTFKNVLNVVLKTAGHQKFLELRNFFGEIDEIQISWVNFPFLGFSP